MTASPPRTTGLAISAWAATSPYGRDREAFVQGVRAGRRAVAPLDPDSWHVPFAEAGVVPDFEARAVLGRKGTRSMDRPTALAVATVGTLLAESSGAGAPPADDVALVLGTSNGSVQSMMDFTRDSLTEAKPYHVDPARFPNTVMNCAAGQCAIWHGLRGPNTTLAGGRATALLALNYARRLWRSGRASTVLCGAVEEFSEQRARLESWNAPDTTVPLGEGCAMFALEPLDVVLARGERPHAELLTLEFGVFAAVEESADVLALLVARALGAAGLDPARIDLVAPSAGAEPLRELERTAIEKALLTADPRWVEVTPLTGDAGAASGTFQIAAVLAQEPAAEHALITSIDRDGVVGCAVLRLPALAPGHHESATER
ncbi:beta-ketoacyl synthase N-terminal-like domain-containing protein [Streptomyces sp. NBC_00059]|uniref:beta-ketoacyl synthase N-terminal-like domain-containing protein n=1 Tax=Streptomyces sp. NBC_00059 TaxID=2975635 RepID=UPI00224CB57C|nr:beta-ketoacyl synthase N-terminal-like domain-containing protein [Streptomyces sp. NBC_00059]MCX5415791.1 3-oxoacyl-ACP synthase [Streptomyces sp. NBC_00059]